MIISAAIRIALVALFGVALWGVIATNVLSRPALLAQEELAIPRDLTAVLRQSGAVIDPFKAKANTISQDMVKFRLPPCKTPFAILPTRIGQSPEGLVRAVMESTGQNYRAYSVYLDRAIGGYAFVQFQLQSLRLRIGQVFGQTHTRYVQYTLLLLVPDTCRDAQLPDLAGFWQNGPTWGASGNG